MPLPTEGTKDKQLICKSNTKKLHVVGLYKCNVCSETAINKRKDMQNSILDEERKQLNVTQWWTIDQRWLETTQNNNFEPEVFSGRLPKFLKVTWHAVISLVSTCP